MNNFISNFFDGNLKEVVSPLFGTNYWIGFSFSVFIIGSLFIFRNFYAKLSKFDYFRYSLGGFQFLIYILYFVFHQLSHDITWKDYMPFHLSSILDLTSAFLLICPWDKLFNTTFPLVGPVILPFLLPDASKRVFGLDNFFFYQYYFNHILIFFGYFYLYLYGHIKYNKLMLKQGINIFTLFALFVFVFNITFDTNYLFIGQVGFSAGAGTLFFNTGDWIGIFRFLFMWAVGLSFTFIFYLLINRFLPPFYFNVGKEVNQYYKNKPSLLKKIHENEKKDLNNITNE